MREFFGRPIIAYSIDTARRSALFDRIVVSTDDEEVARVARSNGAEVAMRGPDLAEVGTQEVGSAVVKRLCERDRTPRHACVIYPCAPLLLASDLREALDAMVTKSALFAYGVHAKTGEDAGAFYWAEGWALLHNFPLVGPRSVRVPLPDERVCDVNVEVDWMQCVRKYAALHPEIA